METKEKDKFIHDERVIGKWQNIGYLDDQSVMHEKSGEFEELSFLENGQPYWIFEGWSKGILYIHSGGDEPILSYKYEIKTTNQQEYLYLYYGDRIELFINIDHKRYLASEIGRHDPIDLPFIDDSNVLGKWKSCGFVDHIDDFKEETKQYDWSLSHIEFLNQGILQQYYMNELWHDKWTRGYVLSLHRSTAGKYSIIKINHQEYLFVEWKMGNYIYGGMNPSYYVFERAAK